MGTTDDHPAPEPSPAPEPVSLGAPPTGTRPGDPDPDEGPGDGTVASRVGLVGPGPATWFVLVCCCSIVATGVQIGLGLADRGVFTLVLTFAIVGYAAWTDAAARLIPNRITYPAILLGLGIAGLASALLAMGYETPAFWLGSPGIRESLLGFSVCAVIGIISLLTRGLGGGDVKLLGALGALLGLSAVLPVLFNTLIVAAVVGVVNLVLRGGLVAKMQVMAMNSLETLVTKRGLTNVYPFAKTEAPFGVSVLAALILAQFEATQLHRYVLALL